MMYYISLLLFTLFAIAVVRLAITYFSSSNSALENGLKKLQGTTHQILNSGSELSDQQLDFLSFLNTTATSSERKLLFFRSVRAVKSGRAESDPAALGKNEVEEVYEQIHEDDLRKKFDHAISAWMTVMVVKNPLVVCYMIYRSFRRALRDNILSTAQSGREQQTRDLLRHFDRRWIH